MEVTRRTFREAYEEAMAKGEDVILYSGILPVERAFSGTNEPISLSKYSVEMRDEAPSENGTEYFALLKRRNGNTM